jgi:hypothetical protein
MKADVSLPNDYRYSISPKKPTILKAFPYQHVFSDRHGFLWNLSVIDLLFNTGSDAGKILSSVAESHMEITEAG